MPTLRFTVEVRLTKPNLKRLSEFEQLACCEAARIAVEAHMLRQNYLPSDAVISVEAWVDNEKPPAITNT